MAILCVKEVEFIVKFNFCTVARAMDGVDSFIEVRGCLGPSKASARTG